MCPGSISKGGWELNLWHFPLSSWWLGLPQTQWVGFSAGQAHAHTHTNTLTTIPPLYSLKLISCLQSKTEELLIRICKPQGDEQSLVYYNSDFLAAQFPAVGFFLWLNSTWWTGRNKWGKEEAIPSKFPYQGLWTHWENGYILESFLLSFK